MKGLLERAMRLPRDTPVLFRDADLDEELRARAEAACTAVDSLRDEIMRPDITDGWVNQLCEARKVEPIRIDRGSISISANGDIEDIRYDDFDCSPHRALIPAVQFAIPFTGDPSLFYCRGPLLTSMYPHAEVGQGELSMVVIAEGGQVEQKLEQQLGLIEQHLRAQNPVVTQHNMKISNEIRRRVALYKERAMESRNLVASLPFPVKKRAQP
jgi:hypothetical protein